MSYFFGAILTVFVVILTAWVQHCYWAKRDKIRYYEKEEEAALSLIEDFSFLSYKRLHRQRRKLWSIKAEDSEQAVEKAYSEVVNEWNEKLGVLLARIKYSFGSEAAWEVEYDIQRGFYILNNEVRKLEREIFSQEKYVEIEQRLNVLGSRIVVVIENLMLKVREGRFSTFPIERQVCFGNRKRLSCSYLLARLFGLG
ncbi:hypothetical protein HNO51_16990 [Billgrantia sulfidoxydans]|uniref:Uncharacterized protein n=1 Tax=Billgrantia sulfidoxydans TaxID=2733484 RepID=A0ABX7W9H9_9GAMM|nr:hypothetical protein [Halomonas sulfidoxydans]QTP56232.1 hypothetical protein HNO51_16990 [Halomonas sulfidoxydans]